MHKFYLNVSRGLISWRFAPSLAASVMEGDVGQGRRYNRWARESHIGYERGTADMKGHARVQDSDSNLGSISFNWCAWRLIEIRDLEIESRNREKGK